MTWVPSAVPGLRVVWTDGVVAPLGMWVPSELAGGESRDVYTEGQTGAGAR